MKCNDTIMRFGFLLVLVSAPVFAVDVRSKPVDYPVQGEASDMRLGAEYMVRTFIDREHNFTIDDYLIVEVGVFPKGEVNLDHRRIVLRINGGPEIQAEAPSAVAASLKYGDWRNKPQITAGAGPIVLGRTPRQPRFPGDPSMNTSDQEPYPFDKIVPAASLPEGKFNRPLAGLMFFPYQKKLKSIKHVELVVDNVPLRLR